MTVKMDDGQQKCHAYLLEPDNTMTLLASGPREWVEVHSRMYLEQHEQNPGTLIVFSMVGTMMSVGAFLERESEDEESVLTRAETGYTEDVHLPQRGRGVPDDHVECDICRQPTTTFYPLSGKTSTLACKRCAEEWWEAYGD